MPQLILPKIPDGATAISDKVSVVWENGRWVGRITDETD